MQILRFEILFNYKKEARRSFVFLMAPTLAAGALITHYLACERDWLSFYFVFKCFCRKYNRFVIYTSTSASFAIFMRSLYIRFATLNCLLRYVCNVELQLFVANSERNILRFAENYSIYTNFTPVSFTTRYCFSCNQSKMCETVENITVTIYFLFGSIVIDF